MTDKIADFEAKHREAILSLFDDSTYELSLTSSEAEEVSIEYFFTDDDNDVDMSLIEFETPILPGFTSPIFIKTNPANDNEY